MNKTLFGTIGGAPVYKRTITGGNLQVDVIDYGCIITDVCFLDKFGRYRKTVLGFSDLKSYVADQDYTGAVVGRFANRIGGGSFDLNGKTYNTTKNERENTLHGGLNGFNRKIWQAVSESENSVSFYYLSADGEEGFPGNLKVWVTYTVESDGVLKIEYRAQSDADTVISLTNHSYFNPDGVENKTDEQTLFIDADYVTAVDEQLIPHGELLEISNTCYDFKRGATVKRVPTGKESFLFRGFFDDNFVLNGKGFRKVASLCGILSGINIDVSTDQAGLQVYTENPFAVALETQNFPNAVNCENFPKAVLKKGEIYSTVTEYKFYLK